MQIEEVVVEGFRFLQNVVEYSIRRKSFKLLEWVKQNPTDVLNRLKVHRRVVLVRYSLNLGPPRNRRTRISMLCAWLCAGGLQLVPADGYRDNVNRWGSLFSRRRYCPCRALGCTSLVTAG